MATLVGVIDWQRWMFVAGFGTVFGAVLILAWFPVAMFRREAVKRDLARRVCQPIHIRWLIFAPWSPIGAGGFGANFLMGIPFRVVYSDFNGFIHKANCWVGHFDSDTPFSPRRVVWVKDKVIGGPAQPEVSR